MVTVRLNPSVDGALAEQLVDMWTRVTNTGGTVGLAPPVTPEDVRPLAQRAFARAAAGLADLAVAFEGEGLPGGRAIGMGLLDQAEGPLERHIGTVRRLMRDPDFAGRGVGVAVLAGLQAAAVRRGIDRLVVEVRAGHGREAWYRARGFEIEAALPDRVRVAGRPVGVVLMSKSLGGGTSDSSDVSLRMPLLQLDPDLPVPQYASPGDAGLDLYARSRVDLAPGARAIVPTGVAVAVPAGYVGLVHPRSGLAARHGIGLVNAPGTIDSGYRGEIKVILVNLDQRSTVNIARGDRVAQLVVQPVEHVAVAVVDELPSSVRGLRGFGSSGR